MRRFAIRALSGIVAVVLLLGLVLFVLVRRNLPGDEGGRLAGLAADVTVDLDDRGVATIRAGSVEDALRAQGWLTARDRAFQLEVLRRNASGRLAELFGASALPLDRKHRVYGFARVAEAAVPLLPPRREGRPRGARIGHQRVLRRAPGPAGARVRVAPDRARALAPGRLRRRPPPDVRAADGRRRGAAGRGEARRPPGVRPRLPAPARHGGRRPPRPRRPAARASVAAARRGLRAARPPEGGLAQGRRRGGRRRVERLRGLRLPDGERQADPRRRPAPRARDAGDLAPDAFRRRGPDVRGGDAPGPAGADDRAHRPGRLELHEPRGRRPGPLPRADRGRTRPPRGRIRAGRRAEGDDPHPRRRGGDARRPLHVATGRSSRTTSPSDGPPSTPRTCGSRTRTSSGPATKPPSSRRSTGSPGPPQNVVWASASGSIGWRPAGLLPVRRAGTDGSVPYDASDPENDWRGFVPMAELPRVVDPPEGFVVTANQRTIGTSFGHVVSADWGHPGRARRIRDLLLRSEGRGNEGDAARGRGDPARRALGDDAQDGSGPSPLPAGRPRAPPRRLGRHGRRGERALPRRPRPPPGRARAGARGLGRPARPLASRGGQLERPPRGGRRGVSRRGARREGRPS